MLSSESPASSRFLGIYSKNAAPHARHAPGGGLNLNFDIACRFGHTALRCSKHL